MLSDVMPHYLGLSDRHENYIQPLHDDWQYKRLILTLFYRVSQKMLCFRGLNVQLFKCTLREGFRVEKKVWTFPD